jgi:hypothetical protein
MRNVYHDSGYAEIAVQMHKELKLLRQLYRVPENQPMDVSDVTTKYYSPGYLQNLNDK